MEERQFRNAMGRFATGITVVSLEYNNEIMAMTVNAFMSVSLSPKLIAISIDEKAKMYSKLGEVNEFGISILSSNQKDFSKIFAKQVESKEQIPFISLDGVPVLQEALAALSCRIVNSLKAGDHIVYIGEVTQYTTREVEPIIFFNGKYRYLK
ncbi:flavin reductase family protein [Paucisalibacillus globulus]|jgi:flavin reductase (DIM6/NTAB) family NADH-FMN oxidoreductase RutF|uniref:flavin reductase family protein n=1 Tax=Paucisalibacillus globulus TaxID=351095 RepID=UPI000BB84F55|nr:flavin reductase family protein [Paucisalibacillus globulus]